MAAVEDARFLDPDVLTPREFVSDAYGRWAPDRLDLFHDMSAEEGFVIDGESLIIEGFSNWNVDWSVGTGQPLHVTYVVEKFLSNFVMRDGLFDIVFFNCNRTLWSMDPAKLITRDCIVKHLSTLLPKKVTIFENWWSQPWSDYLKVQIPPFILCHDGEQLEHVLTVGKRDGRAIEDAQFLLRSFMVDCVVKRFHCVYTTRLVKKDCYIHGFAVRATSNRFLPMGKEIKMGAIVDEIKSLFSEGGSSQFRKTENDFPICTTPLPQDPQGWRSSLARETCKKVMASSSSYDGVKNDLIKAYLLHIVLLKNIPLTSRSQRIEDNETDGLKDRSPYFIHLEDFFNEVTTEIAKIYSLEGGDADAADYCDMWDFRLLRKLLAVLLSNKGKMEGPAVIIDHYKSLVKDVISGDDATDVVLQKVDDYMIPDAIHDKGFDFGLLPTNDLLVKQLTDKLSLSELPETKVLDISSKQAWQGWLSRQNWIANDLEETLKGDDLFKMALQAMAGTYDTQNVSLKKKAKLERRMERSRAKFLLAIQTGAESMQGGFLPHSESRVITKGEDKQDKKQKAPKQGSKAAEIAEKNKLQLEMKDKEAQERAWGNFYARLEIKKDMNADRLESTAADIERFVMSKKVKDRNLLVKARIERIKLLERLWLTVSKNNETREQKQHRYSTAVALFRSLHEMIKEYLKHGNLLNQEVAAYKKTEDDRLEKEKKKGDPKGKAKAVKKSAEATPEVVYKPLFGDDEMQLIRRILITMGLRENCRRVDKVCAEIDGVEYQKDGKHKLPQASSNLKHARVIQKDSANPNDRSHVRFQMVQMGHLFDRNVGKPDPRVKFNPDPWQKDMLDAVDSRESILCCAPTSAGKTFISYYCIKEVMLTSNENVVVYVAPTRALCNQAAQDVYAIFGNKKYTANGWSVFGILGGGSYVQPLPPAGGPFATQVLVTIPSVFEHVMLAPRYQQWAKRVKYVIFDEVHCVDTSAEGHMWERLLLVTRSPFLALSATVGNAKDFQNWLESTQSIVKRQESKSRSSNEVSERSYVVRGVFWEQRWNDLQKFLYVPRTVEERSNTIVKINNAPFAVTNMKPVHPFSTVTRPMLEKAGEFPRDLALVPKECLELYDIMQEAYEIVTCKIEGPWSDDEGSRIKVEGDCLTGRRGVFKGLTGELLKGDEHREAQKLIPSADKIDDEDFADFKKANFIFKMSNEGMLFGRLNDEDELEVLYTLKGDVSCLAMGHEIDCEIMEAMQDGGDLCPETFFEEDIAITQARCRGYEAALKKELTSWIDKGEKDTLARMMLDSVVNSMGGTLHNICDTAENIATEQNTPLDTKEFIEENFTDMLMCLNSQKMLPALIFNFDQAMCEDLTKRIVTDLETSEELYKNTPEWLSFVKRRQELMNQQKKDLKNFKASLSNKKGDKEEGGGGEGEKAEMEPELADFSIPDILPNYAFVHGDRGDALSNEDFEKLIKEVGYDKTHFLIKAISRGIGVHHAGLPAKYRSYVEKLFRLRHLKVVVATDGLALGIHSPCRTVVLAGDDVRLSTMQFRQMSGRAGRRGQDFVGHVVFYGIPEPKIVRLMTSGLNSLKGHVSIDTTTVLRMSLLHSHTGPSKGRDRIEVDQDIVRHMSECILNPLFTLGKSIAQGMSSEQGVGSELYGKQLRLQWRYMTDYLQREGLIHSNGTGNFLPGLVSRTLYSLNEVHMNPSNMLLAALLKRGVFQKVCGSYTRKENASIVGQMTKFLAMLFSKNTMGWRQEVHRAVLKNPEIYSEECPHEVILTPLNELFGGDIWKTMSQYSESSLEIFSDLARKMAEEAESIHGKDITLPFTRISISTETATEGSVLKSLSEQANDIKARSPFVALCGLRDEFHCVDDLIESLRTAVHIEEDSLPLVDFIDLQRRNPQDRWVCINSCVYDYLQEGSQTRDGNTERVYLEEFNGLSQSLSWAILNKFISAVMQTTDLVEKLAPACRKPDQIFTCCNTVCPPQYSKFTAVNGLYKCHDCDKDGIDTWMCPKCYEEGEYCVTKDGDKSNANKTHVFFRHIWDKFVQTMSHIAADLEPLGKDIGRSEKIAQRKKKTFFTEVAKPRRPILAKPNTKGRVRHFHGRCKR